MRGRTEIYDPETNATYVLIDLQMRWWDPLKKQYASHETKQRLDSRHKNRNLERKRNLRAMPPQYRTNPHLNRVIDELLSNVPENTYVTPDAYGRTRGDRRGPITGRRLG